MTTDILGKFTTEIDNGILAQLGLLSDSLGNIAKYYFGWVDEAFKPITGRSGKKLRPGLTLLVYEAITGSYKRALPLAVAIELIHNFSLIHDDIEDRDLERRGRPTLWRIWGDGIALNTGDALHALAFQTLHNLQAPAATIIELHGLLTRAALRITEGQYLDMTFETQTDVSLELYLTMISRKTVALIQCATHAGAFLAECDAELITLYENFGRELGFAFQIRDDYLNLWGDAKILGKSTQSDLIQKKKTLPIVYTLNHLTASEQNQFLEIYRNQDIHMSEQETAYVIAMLDKVDAKGYTNDLVNRYISNALAWLQKVPIENKSQNQLRELSNFLVRRDY